MNARYRYHLARHWGQAPGPVVLWVMLNPSTADDEQDDPTIRRCIGFSRGWGFHGLRVVNLFALRATDPRALADSLDPVGMENDIAITAAVRDGNTLRVIAAWGAHRFARDRALEVKHLLWREAARHLSCTVSHLGLTRSGAPRHPLYVPASQQPIDWPSPARGARAADDTPESEE